MPVYKIRKFPSETSTFFKKSDSETAMFAIMNVIKGIRMNEQTLFGGVRAGATASIRCCRYSSFCWYVLVS